MRIFDYHRITQVQQRAAASFADYDFLYQAVAQRLADRVKDIKRDFNNGLLVGNWQNYLQDIVPQAENAHLYQDGYQTIVIQPDNMQLTAGNYDIIINSFFLHMVDDVPGHLIQLRQALQPDGALLVAFFGGNTLHELRHCLQAAEVALTDGLSPRIMPMIGLQDAAGLLQRAGLALPVADHEPLTVTYPSLTKLLHDLRGMALTNSLLARSRKIPPRQLFTLAEKIYREKFMNTEGQLVATFELITLVGWAPAESQPKPLARGSGTVPLGKFLK